MVDESLSRRVAKPMTAAGHGAVHVGDLDLLGAPDIDAMAAAREGDRTVVSSDTDFGELLAIGQHPGGASSCSDGRRICPTCRPTSSSQL
jgi:predicted nuclease of predicted toxin-antitoxin system